MSTWKHSGGGDIFFFFLKCIMGRIAEEMCDVTFFLSLGEIQARGMASPRSVEEKSCSCLGMSRAKAASFHLELCFQGKLACVDSLVSDKG